MECRHQRKEKDNTESEKEKTVLQGSDPGEDRAPEVDRGFAEGNGHRLLAQSQASRAVESGTKCEPSGRHDCGGLNRHRRKQANTTSEMEEMVRHQAFPTIDGDQYFKLHPVGITHTSFTEQAVERAIYSHSVK